MARTIEEIRKAKREGGVMSWEKLRKKKRTR